MLWSHSGGSSWLKASLLGFLAQGQTAWGRSALDANNAYAIQWQPCSNGSKIDCGTLQVPLDWANTSSGNITLGIQRVNASDSSKRKGSLFFNPGGPGVPATTLCSVYTLAFSADLLASYDLICPDPRGVGTSFPPVQCDPQIWNKNISITPTNETQFEALVDLSEERGHSCLNMTGDLLRHIDTGSVARDFDAIRQALGEEKLNFLGQSYGTVLGAEYVKLFPGNVGAMAFDAVENRGLDPAATLFVKSTTYENELQQFFAWCETNATRCGFSSDDLQATWQQLIVNATTSPIAAAGCTGNTSQCRAEVTGNDIIINAQNLLTWQNTTLGVLPGWEGFGKALNQTINDGDATAFSSALASNVNDTIFAGAAIECLDWERATNITRNETMAFSTFQQLQLMGASFNPSVRVYSNAWVRETNCVAWPFPPVSAASELNTTTAAELPPILLVASNHDPFTSYVWALGMKIQLPSSVLVTREGNGHTSYLLHGEASRIIDAFFVNGTVPVDGTTVTS